jgi:hypothetical protein
LRPFATQKIGQDFTQWGTEEKENKVMIIKTKSNLETPHTLASRAALPEKIIASCIAATHHFLRFTIIFVIRGM